MSLYLRAAPCSQGVSHPEEEEQGGSRVRPVSMDEVSLSDQWLDSRGLLQFQVRRFEQSLQEGYVCVVVRSQHGGSLGKAMFF